MKNQRPHLLVHQENENSLRFILQLPTKKRGILHVHFNYLRKIPSDNEISEDESEPEEGDSPEEEADNFACSDQDEPEEYKIKWSIQFKKFKLDNFNQPSGPNKTLPSSQRCKKFLRTYVYKEGLVSHLQGDK